MAGIAPLTLGAVELVFITLDSERPEAGVIDALSAQVFAGTVRLLDLVIVTVDERGEVHWDEAEGAEYELSGLRRRVPGLIGGDDIRQLASRTPPGGHALVALLELSWLRRLSAEIADAGGTVTAVELIPAAVANAVLDLAADTG